LIAGAVLGCIIVVAAVLVVFLCCVYKRGRSLPSEGLLENELEHIHDRSETDVLDESAAVTIDVRRLRGQIDDDDAAAAAATEDEEEAGQLSAGVAEGRVTLACRGRTDMLTAFVLDEGGGVAFQDGDGRYLTADADGTVKASRRLGRAQVFNVSSLGDRYVVRGSNNKCLVESIGDMLEFAAIEIPGLSELLEAAAISAEATCRMFVAAPGAEGCWDVVTICFRDAGVVVLRASAGKFIASRGDRALSATGETEADADEFTVSTADSGWRLDNGKGQILVASAADPSLPPVGDGSPVEPWIMLASTVLVIVVSDHDPEPHGKDMSLTFPTMAGWLHRCDPSMPTICALPLFLTKRMATLAGVTEALWREGFMIGDGVKFSDQIKFVVYEERQTILVGIRGYRMNGDVPAHAFVKFVFIDESLTELETGTTFYRIENGLSTGDFGSFQGEIVAEFGSIGRLESAVIACGDEDVGREPTAALREIALAAAERGRVDASVFGMICGQAFITGSYLHDGLYDQTRDRVRLALMKYPDSLQFAVAGLLAVDSRGNRSSRRHFASGDAFAESATAALKRWQDRRTESWEGLTREAKCAAERQVEPGRTLPGMILKFGELRTLSRPTLKDVLKEIAVLAEEGYARFSRAGVWGVAYSSDYLARFPLDFVVSAECATRARDLMGLEQAACTYLEGLMGEAVEWLRDPSRDLPAAVFNALAESANPLAVAAGSAGIAGQSQSAAPSGGKQLYRALAWARWRVIASLDEREAGHTDAVAIGEVLSALLKIVSETVEVLFLPTDVRSELRSLASRGGSVVDAFRDAFRDEYALS
jgi:hypothetical protein